MIAAETFPFARDRRRSVQSFLLLVTFTEEGASTQRYRRRRHMICIYERFERNLVC